MAGRFNPDEYIGVHERVERFYERYPEGRIIPAILEHDPETGFVLMRAEVYRKSDDALPAATGHAYELRSAGHVQQGSYVEVCETSAVGRALALLGFEVKRQPGVKPGPRPVDAPPAPADLNQQIEALLKELGEKDSFLVLWSRERWKNGQITDWRIGTEAARMQMLNMLINKKAKGEAA